MFERWIAVAEFALLIGIVFLVIAIPLYHGIDRSFLANSDADLYHSGHALDVLSAAPLRYYPHTGYLYFLVLAAVLWVAEGFGYVHSVDWETIRTATDFVAAYSPIVISGRVLAVAMAVTLLVLFWWTARRLTHSRVLALVAAFALATSIGLVVQSNQLRTELLSMLFVLGAFAALVAANSAVGGRRLVAVVAVGFFAYAAAMTKIQAVLIVLFLPLMAVVLAAAVPWVRPAQPHERPPLYVSVAFFLISIPAWWAILSFVSFDANGWYQPVIFVYVLVCIGAALRFIDATKLLSIAVVAAALFGVAAAQSLVLIEPHTWTTEGIVNFVAAGSEYTKEGGASGAALVGGAAGNVWHFVSSHLTPEHALSRAYPFGLIYWAAAAAVVYLLARGQTKAALLPGLLWGMATVLPAAFMTRGYFTFYYLYVEPFAILSLVTGIATITRAGRLRHALHLCVVVLCLVVGGMQARYILIAPSTATTRTSVDCTGGYAPQLAAPLMAYCRATLKPVGDGV